MKTYSNLKGIAFVGDLSLEDADLLAYYGYQSRNILEFGSGGSTQIFAQCGPEVLVSVETDINWIEKTKNRISGVLGAVHPEFVSYGDHPEKQYDLIFVDGVDDRRRDFAINTWKLLSNDGVMLFHDTRRFPDFANAAWVAQLHHNEIKLIEVNANDSNMTIIHKKPHQPYVNWNESEGKPLWAYGAYPNPNGDELWSIKN